MTWNGMFMPFNLRKDDDGDDESAETAGEQFKEFLDEFKVPVARIDDELDEFVMIVEFDKSPGKQYEFIYGAEFYTLDKETQGRLILATLRDEEPDQKLLNEASPTE